MRGDFTLSYHFFKQRDSRNHLELFLDTDGTSALETWRCYETLTPSLDQGGGVRVRRFVAAPAHRRVYLEFSGRIEGNRGKLRILRKGKFIDRRTRMFEVSTVQEAHLSADRSRRHGAAIRVTL